MLTCHCWQLFVLCPFLLAYAPRGENKHHLLVPQSCQEEHFSNSRSGQASFPKDVVKFVEDELHRLVLVNHVDRHVTVVPLWAH